MADVKEVRHSQEDPLRIILYKRKEGYGWKITFSGKTIDEIMPVIN
jgi:hypothetical protein